MTLTCSTDETSNGEDICQETFTGDMCVYVIDHVPNQIHLIFTCGNQWRKSGEKEHTYGLRVIRFISNFIVIYIESININNYKYT